MARPVSSGRTDFQAAAADVGARFADALAAVPFPSAAGDSWKAKFNRPGGVGQAEEVVNLLVPANTVVVFVGARDLVGELTLESSDRERGRQPRLVRCGFWSGAGEQLRGGGYRLQPVGRVDHLRPDRRLALRGRPAREPERVRPVLGHPEVAAPPPRVRGQRAGGRPGAVGRCRRTGLRRPSPAPAGWPRRGPPGPTGRRPWTRRSPRARPPRCLFVHRDGPRPGRPVRVPRPGGGPERLRPARAAAAAEDREERPPGPPLRGGIGPAATRAWGLRREPGGRPEGGTGRRRGRRTPGASPGR